MGHNWNAGMDVDAIRQARIELETQLFDDISKRLHAFREATGLSASGAYVLMVPNNFIGEKSPSYCLVSVDVELRI